VKSLLIRSSSSTSTYTSPPSPYHGFQHLSQQYLKRGPCHPCACGYDIGVDLNLQEDTFIAREKDISIEANALAKIIGHPGTTAMQAQRVLANASVNALFIAREFQFLSANLLSGKEKARKVGRPNEDYRNDSSVSDDGHEFIEEITSIDRVHLLRASNSLYRPLICPISLRNYGPLNQSLLIAC